MSRIRKSGGYRDLRTFQSATLIYDATHWFCEKYLNPRSRTIDQMVQAARSGRQNIAEGSRAAATSSQTELRLVNVARASLEELLLDYEDFLRHRRQQQWAKDDPQAQAVRLVARDHRSDQSDLPDQQRAALYAEWLEHDDPFVRANALICLIHQTNYLLDQQINALEKQFIEEGGYSEQLAAKRLQHRSDQSDPSDQSDFPACPQCGKPMVLRTAKTGQNNRKPVSRMFRLPRLQRSKEFVRSDRSVGSVRSDRSKKENNETPNRNSAPSLFQCRPPHRLHWSTQYPRLQE